MSDLSNASPLRGLFRVKASTGVVTALVTTDDMASNGSLFDDFTAISMTGKEAVFLGSLDDDPVSGGGTLSSLAIGEPLSLVGSAIVFEAFLDAPSGASLGLISNKP